MRRVLRYETSQLPNLSFVPLRGAGLWLWRFASRGRRRLAEARILAVGTTNNEVCLGHDNSEV